MKLRPMRLRAYLLAVNAVSIVAILALLFLSYSRMLLDAATFAWLGGATIAAGLVSFALHFALIKPLERSVSRIGEASGSIAAGSFGTEVPIVGPTEFRELAERFNEMSRKLKGSFDQLKLAERSRQELVANVAHDLRTPLALLQSHAEALQDGLVQEPDTFHRYLETIRLESVRLGALVQDLFDLSRIDAGQATSESSRIALEDVLIQTLNAFSPKIENKRLRVDVSLPEPSPLVWGAEADLRRVAGNLLDNAIRHSRENGAIYVSAIGDRSGSGEVTVRIRDEGDGIAPRDLDKIFERFYRSDQSRTRDGSGAGLGLAIAKSLTERMGGTIGVESELGRGSAFWFTIPATRGQTERRR